MWWLIGRELAFIYEVKDLDPYLNDKKVKIITKLQNDGPCTVRKLGRTFNLKKEDRANIIQWVREGELVTSNASKGNKPSPTFAIVGDDRIPEGVRLITQWCFNCLYCPYSRIVIRGNGAVGGWSVEFSLSTSGCSSYSVMQKLKPKSSELLNYPV